jgi:hypothetical protein
VFESDPVGTGESSNDKSGKLFENEVRETDFGETRPLGDDFGETRPLDNDFGETRPLDNDFGETRPLDNDFGETRPLDDDDGDDGVGGISIGECDKSDIVVATRSNSKSSSLFVWFVDARADIIVQIY